MKKIFLMLFALLSLVAKAQNTSDKSSADVKGIIFFNGTFAEALAEAKKTNKGSFRGLLCRLVRSLQSTWLRNVFYIKKRLETI